MSEEKANASWDWDMVFQEIERLYAERPIMTVCFGSKDKHALGGWYVIEDGHHAFYVHCTQRFNPGNNWDTLPLFNIRFRDGTYVVECNKLATTVHIYEKACALADLWNKEERA